MRDKKQRRSRLESYLAAIQALTPEEFEKLCGKIIEILGVTAPRVTRRSADDGIDFYGKLEGARIFFAEDDLHPTVQRQLSVWLVGQAKQYIKVQAGTPEVREIVGAVQLRRGGAFQDEGFPFPDLKIRANDPVFTMLVTGGTLSSNAWQLLERSGVIGIDGELLAAFLADRDSGPSPDPTIAQFREWLAQQQ